MIEGKCKQAPNFWFVKRTASRFMPGETAADALAAAHQLHGHGIGSIPKRFVEQMPEGKNLVRILPAWQIAPIEIVALFRDGSSTSLKTRLFLDFLEGWFRSL